MTKRVAVALIALGVALGGCSDGARDRAAPPAPTQPEPPVVPVDWTDPGLAADLGAGWTARRCEGDAPLL